MNSSETRGAELPRTTTPRSGFSAGRIAGVSIFIDWSVLAIFVLLVSSLAMNVLPSAHPNWPMTTRWITALAAGFLFFGSVLAHELSHALVGRALGIPIHRITLFIFGGLAHMEGEPKRPMAELGMTIVGPLTSLGLGIAFTWIGLGMAGPNFGELAKEEPISAIRLLSPASTLLLWLGPVNVMLGLFNLIPGFPLDGGRVLRAILWATTGSYAVATRWATRIGRAFGYALIAIGALMVLGWYVPFFGGGFLGGLWIALIGWFLATAARESYRQMIMKDALTGVPVTRLMTLDYVTIPAGLSLDRFVELYVMRHDQRCFPVFADERMLGLVCIEDVKHVPRQRWETTTVDELMKPASELAVTAEANANDAMEKLGRREVDQLPVVKDGALLGLVRKTDILRWLRLMRELPAGG